MSSTEQTNSGNSDTIFEVPIQGMNCANCALGVEKHLRARGCIGAKVSISTASAFIPKSSDWSRDDVAREIRSLGYQTNDPHKTRSASPSLHDESTSMAETGPMTEKGWWPTIARAAESGAALAIASVATLPFLLHMVMHVPYIHNPAVQAALATIACSIGLVRFIPRAIASLKARLPNMEVLISIGILASLGYSAYGWAIGQAESFAFFEGAATISTLVMLGNWLEHRVSSRTKRSLAELIQLQPHTAMKVVGDTRISVETSTLEIGDFVALNAGDSVPVDCTITSGSLSLDEAIATGEATPVEKTVGGELLAGTVVLQGSGIASVLRREKESFVASMVQMVRLAQSEKAPIALMADKVAAIFVPLILLIGVVTVIGGLLWGLPFSEALTRGIAVLVISCPCALGLATPAAVMIGMGRAAKMNVLFRSGEAIETLARAKSIAFDKTGTLTKRELSVSIVPVTPTHSSVLNNQTELEGAVKALELHSSHPVARALVEQLASTVAVPFSKVEEIPGTGMHGLDQQGNDWFVGRDGNRDSSSPTVISRNGVVIGTIVVEEKLRSGASESVRYFLDRDMPVAVVSGDHSARVKQLPLPDSVKRFGEQTPQDKQKTVEQLPKPAVFVGDGVNDAPVLASAAVGVSLADGSGIAQNTAGVVLVGANLNALTTAHRIAQATLTTIRQNLMWALAYNVVAVPIAMLGMLNPSWAALTMAFSDLVLVVNSLRLQMKRFPQV